MWFRIQKNWELVPNPLATEPFPSSLTLVASARILGRLYRHVHVLPSTAVLLGSLTPRAISLSPCKGCLRTHFPSRVVKQ